LPASPDTVEINAAPKASPNPTSASKNFTHTSADADCSHAAARPLPACLNLTELL
jgi:hypothetical protein